MATADLLSMDSKRNPDKQKALDSALAQIERQFGKGSIMKLGADNPVQEIEATSKALAILSGDEASWVRCEVVDGVSCTHD